MLLSYKRSSYISDRVMAKKLYNRYLRYLQLFDDDCDYIDYVKLFDEEGELINEYKRSE